MAESSTLKNSPSNQSSEDTQWPRWEVFKRDTEKRPYQSVGSVHAGDPDHALVTARNVFVRRPAAVSLWVVRESDILLATPEELEANPALLEIVGPSGTYHVGIKETHRRKMTFVDLVGTVEATSPGDALRQARVEHAQAIAWMVFADAVLARTDEDLDTVESWFAPAKDKTYRQQKFYGTIGRHVSEFKHAGKAPARNKE